MQGMCPPCPGSVLGWQQQHVQLLGTGVGEEMFRKRKEWEHAGEPESSVAGVNAQESPAGKAKGERT